MEVFLAVVVGPGCKNTKKRTGFAATTQLLKKLLFGMIAIDLLSFGSVMLLLIEVALVACWIPAQRTTKVDPLAALRLHRRMEAVEILSF
jgi:ABC-type lipoprotein release transport system permease subunit